MTIATGNPITQNPKPITSKPIRQSVTAISHTINGTRTPPTPDPADMMASALPLLAMNQLATAVVITKNVPNESPSVISEKAA